jgi:CRISPR-associated endonuclease Csn1
MKTPKRVPYVLGIDLGANSIGWAILDVDGDGPVDVRATGVRAFEAAAKGDLESGKEESCAQDRRMARGARRRLERIAMRSFGLFQLLQQNGMLPPSPPVEPGNPPPKSHRKIFAHERAARDAVLAGLDRILLPA